MPPIKAKRGPHVIVYSPTHPLKLGAADWHYGYHQAVGQIKQTSIREALRHKVKDPLVDWDILKLMQDRSRNPSDDLGSFHKPVHQLAKPLESPLTEMIVELLVWRLTLSPLLFG